MVLKWSAKGTLATLAAAWCFVACGDGVAYIAHQGEEALAPSHSKAAYRLAVEHGLDYMKLDVRETKDGHVVLQHDADLWATMRWKEKIANLTLAEIRAKGRCHTRTPYTNETITTLPEALEISKGMRKGVWIDFKHFTPAFAQKVFAQLDAAGYTDDRIMVATFTKPALAWVKEHRPNVRRVAHTSITQDAAGFHVNDGKGRVYANEKEVADALDRALLVRPFDPQQRLGAAVARVEQQQPFPGVDQVDAHPVVPDVPDVAVEAERVDVVALLVHVVPAECRAVGGVGVELLEGGHGRVERLKG